jgi:oligopeptide/dipeptide ABC transporter ATP-binding protein
MLLASIPVVTLEEQQARPPWPWDRSTAPDLAATGHGCPFRPRCPYAVAACATEEPDLTLLAPEHSARCHNPASPEAPV